MTTAPFTPTTDRTQELEHESRAAISQQLVMLEKTLRATQLYLVNNPVYQASLDSLTASFRMFWRTEDELILGITSDGFEWHGVSFGNDPDHPERLAWLLYRDGLRSLTLAPGCEQQELVRLLMLVNSARMKSRTPGHETDAHDVIIQRGDDLLTLLWPEEFAFIQYEFVEAQHQDFAPIEITGPMYNVGTPEDLQQQIEADVADATSGSDEASGVVKLDDTVATLKFLDEKEIERLKREIDDEYRTQLHTTVLAILFDIFEVQTYGAPQDEIVTIIEDLIPHYLASRDYGVLAYILRESRDIARRETTGSDTVARLDAIPAKISSPEVLNDLLQLLDDSPTPPCRNDLSELLGQLRPQSISTILDWIPRLRNSTVKGVLSLALDPIAKTNPKHVIYNLSSLGPQAIVAALEIVERLGLRAIADDVVKFATHENPSVRKATADALAALGTPASMMALTQLVKDSDRDVRMTATAKIGAAKFVTARPAIEEAIESLLRAAPLSEKRVYFEAFAELSGESGVKPLDQRLNSKRFLRRRGDPDTRACAAMALGMIGSPAALAALRRALEDKEPIVRNAVEKALRESVT